MSYILVECEHESEELDELGESQTCGAQVTINKVDFDFDVVDTDPSRQMGTEYTYEATIEAECDNGHIIEVTHTFWEYPEGCENHKETKVSCGRIIENKL